MPKIAQTSAKPKQKEKANPWLTLGQLRAEKAELAEARAAYTLALQAARRNRSPGQIMEAISGLLRMASEANDPEAIRVWDQELDAFVAAHPTTVLPMVWYCKASVAQHERKSALAQHYFLKCLRQLRRLESQPAECEVLELSTEELRSQTIKVWSALSLIQVFRGHTARAELIAQTMLARSDVQESKSYQGIFYTALGLAAETRGDLDRAWKFIREAHGAFFAAHNWYYHLYLLVFYARLSRLQGQFSQAWQYLDLVSRATDRDEYGRLKLDVAQEREQLEKSAVDLLIDGREGVVRTRDAEPIALGKQYVLLHILEALAAEHQKGGIESERGLTKAEIIERVWGESYRPRVHDNKLYYNINRLRKLLEPDVHHPRYLLNSKDGYRLSPGLRVQFIGGQLRSDDKFEEKSEEKSEGTADR